MIAAWACSSWNKKRMLFFLFCSLTLRVVRLVTAVDEQCRRWMRSRLSFPVDVMACASGLTGAQRKEMQTDKADLDACCAIIWSHQKHVARFRTGKQQVSGKSDETENAYGD